MQWILCVLAFFALPALKYQKYLAIIIAIENKWMLLSKLYGLNMHLCAYDTETLQLVTIITIINLSLYLLVTVKISCTSPAAIVAYSNGTIIIIITHAHHPISSKWITGRWRQRRMHIDNEIFQFIALCGIR